MGKFHRLHFSVGHFRIYPLYHNHWILLDRQGLVIAPHTVSRSYSRLPAGLWKYSSISKTVDHPGIDDLMGIKINLQLLEKRWIQKRWRRLPMGIHQKELSQIFGINLKFCLYRLLPSLSDLPVLCTHQICLCWINFSDWLWMRWTMAPSLDRGSCSWLTTMEVPNQKVLIAEVI